MLRCAARDAKIIGNQQVSKPMKIATWNVNAGHGGWI